MAVGDFPLVAKIVLITGGGSGIGLACAKLAAHKGNKIIIADLKLTQEAEVFVKESQDVLFTKCDVTVHTDLEGLIEVSEKEFGDVPDVYMPVAGIFVNPSASFWFKDASAKSIYSELNVNLHPIPLTRIAVSALLRKDKKGVVLVVSSVVGLIPSPPSPVYSATKYGLVGFVRSMRPADEEGIKVCAICPGFVSTPLWAGSGLKEHFAEDEQGMKAEYVASVMMDLVQEGKYGGGSITALFSKDEIKVVLEDSVGMPETDLAMITQVNEVASALIRQAFQAERGIA